jgi:hypothetical protein
MQPKAFSIGPGDRLSLSCGRLLIEVLLKAPKDLADLLRFAQIIHGIDEGVVIVEQQQSQPMFLLCSYARRLPQLPFKYLSSLTQQRDDAFDEVVDKIMFRQRSHGRLALILTCKLLM